MLVNTNGKSKKISIFGMVGHCSRETAKELKRKYGKLLKVESTIKQHKVNKSGPCVSIPVSEYLRGN